MSTFEDIAAPLDEEHLNAAAVSLAAFARARTDIEAWPVWRDLERDWLYLSPESRRALRAVAQRILPGAVDGSRRLAVVERLPL